MLDYLRTYLFLIPLVVLVFAEVTKMVIDQLREGTWHARLFQPGGFPSSHSAFVTSLLIVVGRKLGLESTEFAIAFVFAAIVWYDAMSARRALGEQAKILNRLQHWQHFRERLGHSLTEVLGGITFGAIVTVFGIWLSA
jgi:acid phosphatase family membrane protein YuiD